MKRTVVLIILAQLAFGVPRGDAGSITFFSDGALAEMEATATGGVIELPLPAGMLENSLQVKPLAGTQLRRVELQTVRRRSRGAQELDGLLERRSRLEDRLQALKTREEIFRAAVKSQSSKAPRKTKNNPDPLLSIRQGTDFAMAQLEAVNTARRKTVAEMGLLDGRIAEARRAGTGVDTVARISVVPGRGRVRARYALADRGWTPRYDIRLHGDGKAGLTLYGQVPETPGGFQPRVSPAALAGGDGAPSYPASAGSLVRLLELVLPSEQERFENGPAMRFSATLTNGSAAHLPAGEASVFRGDDYVGRVRFDGISSGRSRRVSQGD